MPKSLGALLVLGVFLAAALATVAGVAATTSVALRLGALGPDRVVVRGGQGGEHKANSGQDRTDVLCG